MNSFIAQAVEGVPQTAVEDNPSPQLGDPAGSNLFPVAVIDGGVSYNDPALAPYILRRPGDHRLILGIDFNEDDSLPFDGPAVPPFETLTERSSQQSWLEWISENKEALAKNILNFLTIVLKPGSQGHGTHVSGIVLKSCYFECGIMPIKVFGKNPPTLDMIIDAIEFAKLSGVRVINMSLGYEAKVESYTGGKPVYQDQKAWDRLQKAIESSPDILFVVAAGNSNIYFTKDEKCFFPACLDEPNVITVGAIDELSRLANFTNYDPQKVHIYAPGVNIKSNWINNEWKEVSGTSMAAPYIAGMASYIWNHSRRLTASQLKEVLIEASLFSEGMIFKKYSLSEQGKVVYTHTSNIRSVIPEAKKAIEENIFRSLKEL
ncbi:MAG: S8 family serine peptidase [Bdellovibrionales bacterium]|nr:S8 family serine peptidase [Bdellovibrionales bacterium]